MLQREETLPSVADSDEAFESDSRGSSSTHSAAPGAYPAPERPALPKPERLNRNALTVVAVVMGVLVLAAVVFVQPKNTVGTSQTVRAAPEMAHGTFLDQPTASSATSSANSGASAAPSFDRGMPGVQPGSQGQQGMGSGDIGGAGSAAGGAKGGATGSSYDSYNQRAYPDPYGVTSDATYGANGSAMSAAPAITAPRVDHRAEAYRAALEAPLVASEAASAVASVAASAAATQNAGQEVSSAGADYRTSGGRLGFISTGGPAHGTMNTTVNATVIRTSVDPAPGPYAIQAGTLIPAVLMTEINSDLPGEVLAQVSRDVYDSRSEQALLIPKGSRLIGKYDNQVATGQKRLLVAWTRVIFPDGRSVSLPGLETKDRTGAGGLHDQVDQHKRRTFGTAALLSLISAGAQLSQPNRGYDAYGSYPSTGQIAAGAMGQQLSEVATQMLRRNMDAQPTIRIRQGMPFNVFLNGDMTFPGPYTDQHTDQPGRFTQ